MKAKTALRIFIDILIIVFIIFGWWPVSLLLSIWSAWKFDYFFEIILAGLAYDALFEVMPGIEFKSLLGVIIATILLFAVNTLKKVLRVS